MSAQALSELEGRLLRPAEPGAFGDAELDGLPEPVRRHLAAAIAPGTPLAASARLRMRGRIKSAAGCRSGPARDGLRQRACGSPPRSCHGSGVH